LIHSSTTPSISLPIIAEVPLDGFNSEDSDEEVASTTHPAHDVSAVNTNPVTITSTMPVDRPTSPVPLTANPTRRRLARERKTRFSSSSEDGSRER
jgi:hypothetical protein